MPNARPHHSIHLPPSQYGACKPPPPPHDYHFELISACWKIIEREIVHTTSTDYHLFSTGGQTRSFRVISPRTFRPSSGTTTTPWHGPPGPRPPRGIHPPLSNSSLSCKPPATIDYDYEGLPKRSLPLTLSYILPLGKGTPPKSVSLTSPASTNQRNGSPPSVTPTSLSLSLAVFRARRLSHPDDPSPLASFHTT